MTMNDIKPFAVEEFNKYIEDVFARDYFAESFDLWEDSESKYTSSNNAYKVIIKRHIQPIKAEIRRTAALLDVNYTKTQKTLNTELTEENKNVNEANANETTDSRTITDGEFTQTQRQYPDGYTDAPDTAYIRAQTADSEFVKTDAYNSEQNNAKTIDEKNDKQSSLTAETNEIDALAQGAQLEAYKSAMRLIEKCVFEFVANDIDGVL